MWQMWVGRILVFSNAVVPAVGILLGVELGWWNAVYALLTGLAALIVGQIGKA